MYHGTHLNRVTYVLWYPTKQGHICIMVPTHLYTTGVFGFYLAQLAPVVQYKDLRTDVFQAFKELGNSVIFALLLEKALGQQEVVDLLQAAPFQNMYPRPYVKGKPHILLFPTHTATF